MRAVATAPEEANSRDYVALVAAGLAAVAIAEIESVLLPLECVACAQPPPSDQWAPDGCDSVFPGTAGVTKLRIRVRSPESATEWAALRRALVSLKSVQCILALVGVHTAIPLDAATALPAIEDAARSAAESCWGRALETWRNFNPVLRSASGSTPSFRASAVRDGQHDYTSVDVAQALGRAVAGHLGWRPRMIGAQVEVIAVLLQRELVLALSLTEDAKGFRRGRLPVEPRPLLPHADITARLRFSTAFILLQLAQLQPGDILCDPMCGVGTLPLEAVATSPMLAALAGDIDTDLVVQAHANGVALRSAQQVSGTQGLPTLPLLMHAPHHTLAPEGQNGEARLGSGRLAHAPEWHYREREYAPVGRGSGVLACTWDAMRLPLRPGCIDVCLVDLPFGMAHKVRNGHTLHRLYHEATKQAARILRCGGRLVMLTPSRAALEHCLGRQVAWWYEKHYFRVNCGGALACVCVWIRTAAPFDAGERVRKATPMYARYGSGGAGCVPIDGLSKRAQAKEAKKADKAARKEVYKKELASKEVHRKERAPDSARLLESSRNAHTPLALRLCEPSAWLCTPLRGLCVHKTEAQIKYQSLCGPSTCTLL